MKEEVTSEIENRLIESQKEMLKLLKPETRESVRENVGEEIENETRSFYTPTKTVRTNSTLTNNQCSSRNVVTGVLTDSTNQPKRTKARSQSEPTSKERPVVARTLFAPEKNDGTALPMPKAFDGKSEKFELFEDLFRKNIKMYPHLTEIQKINFFHSLLRGDALKAFCNIEDSKKHSLDEIVTIFKRRFGDYLLMTKARCEWDALEFDPSTHKLHEFLDVLQKTAKEAFGSEAQQFIDKAIYAKMPDHVKKILNRSYLEDKPYNDIVLRLGREMRLNGLESPEEVTLVPLNKVEPAPTKPETKQVENPTQNTKRGTASIAINLQGGMEKNEKGQMATDQKKQLTNQPQCKQTAQMRHVRQTEGFWNGANSANDPRPKRHITHEQTRDIPVQPMTANSVTEPKN